MKKVTKKKRYKNINEVWGDIDNGIKIFWENESYQLIIEPDPCPEKKLSSNRGGKCLRVTCLYNWFGSRLEKSDIHALFSFE